MMEWSLPWNIGLNDDERIACVKAFESLMQYNTRLVFLSHSGFKKMLRPHYIWMVKEAA